MKWIGQHIWSFISRFRNDVYLEDISSGTIASGGNLGLDTNNKIVKATEASGDITGVTITTDSGGGSAASDTAGSADFSILGNNGVGVTNSGTTITAVAVPGEIDHDSLNNFSDTEHFTQEEITTVGTIDEGVWNGTAITYQYINADQRNVTTLGTIGTGTWQGTAIASAYLDADTAHYSLSRQFTHHMMTDNIGTSTKVYIALQETDAESTSATNKNLPFLIPGAGKLLKVLCRIGGDCSGATLTWTLETTNTSSNTASAPSVIGTQSGTGPTAKTMTTYDFTSSLDSGTNALSAGDTVQLGVSSNASTGNFKWYVTCIWEFDLS